MNKENMKKKNMNKRILSVIISVVLLTFPAGGGVGAKEVPSGNKAISGRLDTYLTALEQNKNFHGSILVAKSGSVLLRKGYGMANFEEKVRNTSKTRFAIGSIAKQFTAMAVMQLYEKGRLGLNDKLSEYLPDFPNGNKITIHNLLTHTSGLVNFTDLPGFYSMKISETSIDTIIGLFKNQPLKSKPGEKYEYCNSGYVLLSHIIEIRSGLSYGNYLKKNIFKPLGMGDTGLFTKTGRDIQKTTGYFGYLEVSPIAEDIIMRATYGAGSLYSTVDDLYKWDRALYTGKLLKKANISKMFKSYVKMPEEGYSYGYGWVSSKSPYGAEVMHGGGTASFSSFIGRYIGRDFTVIILTNSPDYNVAGLANTLADISHGKAYTIPKPVVTAKIDKRLYQDYAGQYEFTPDIKIEITTDGNHLYAQLSGQSRFEIFPETPSRFYYKITEAEITFQRDSSGKVNELTLHQDGAQSKAVKQ